MVQKTGGLTEAELEELRKVFVSFTSRQDMTAKIRSIAGLRHPAFHGVLRQLYVPAKATTDPQKKRQTAAFIKHCETFFSILYADIYAAQLASAGIQAERAATAKQVRMEVDRLVAFVVCREDLIAAALVRLLEIMSRAQVGTIIGASLQAGTDPIRLLPETYPEIARRLFEPTAGYAIELVEILAALRPRSYMTLPSHPNTAHAITCFWDPTAGVSFIAPIRTFLKVDRGDAFDAHLQDCARVLHPAIFPDWQQCVPIGTLAANFDAAGDALLQTMHILAIGNELRLFVMPGFSSPEAATDRVIEVRTTQLLRLCEPPLEQPVTPMRVVYSRSELQDLMPRMLENMQSERSRPRLLGQVLFEEIGRKVVQGAVDLDVAISHIQRRLGGAEVDIPLYLANDTGGDPMAELVSISLAEAVQQMRREEYLEKAALAVHLGNKCLLMGESGRARAALARARSALEQLGSGPAGDRLRSMLLSCESQLMLERQDAAGAITSLGKALDLLRPAAADFETLGGHHVEAALNFAQYLNQLGGSQDQAGLPTEALRTYGECRQHLQRITHYLEQHGEEFPSNDPVRLQSRYVTGATLANEATILQHSAEMLGKAAASLPCRTLGEFLSLAMALQDIEDCDTAFFVQLFNADLLRDAPREASLGEAKVSLLRLAYARMGEALAISTELKGWNYASIQAWHCADLAQALSEGDRVIAGYLEQAIGFAETARNLAQLGPMCARMADFKERSGSLDEAAEYCGKAIRHSRAHAIAAATTATAEDLRRTYRGMVSRGFDLLRRLDRTFECVALAETAKSVFLSLDIQRGIPGMQPTGNESALTERLEALLAEREGCTKTFLANDDSSQLDRIVTLDAEIATLRGEIAVTDPRCASWTRWSDVHDLLGEELRKHLRDSNAVAIGAFSKEDDDIHLYVVSADHCLICPTCLRRSEAAEAVELFQQYSRSDDPKSFGSVLDTLRVRWPQFVWVEENAARLIKPGTQYIIVAPDDALYGFPWGILAPAGRPLPQFAPIVIAVGLDSMLTNAPQVTDAVTSGECLVLSDPLVGSRYGLPNADDEVRKIVGNWGAARVTVLAGARATVDALIEMAPASRLIHLACHGCFGGIGDNAAELWLAPGNGARTQSGVLTSAEIVRSLDLTNCSLVNISACGVGRLNEKRGAGVDGIVSALLIVGARNVIGCVNALHDDAAVCFSGWFYKELVTGVSPAQALARTQLACLNGELGPSMCLPRHWAGYLVFCAAVERGS